MQIQAKEGDIVFFNMITYGYGDTVEWSEVAKQKDKLEEWAKGICKRHKCSFDIHLTANYW